jgi:hypothetical protein
MTIEVTAEVKNDSAVARNRTTIVLTVINHQDVTATTIAMKTKDPTARIAGVMARPDALPKANGKIMAVDHGLANATTPNAGTVKKTAMVECRVATPVNVIAEATVKAVTIERLAVTAANVIGAPEDMETKIAMENHPAITRSDITIQQDSDRASLMAAHHMASLAAITVTVIGTVKVMPAAAVIMRTSSLVAARNEVGGIGRRTKFLPGLATKKQSEGDRWIDNAQSFAAEDRKITGALMSGSKRTSMIA